METPSETMSRTEFLAVCAQNTFWARTTITDIRILDRQHLCVSLNDGRVIRVTFKKESTHGND